MKYELIPKEHLDNALIELQKARNLAKSQGLIHISAGQCLLDNQAQQDAMQFQARR